MIIRLSRPVYHPRVRNFFKKELTDSTAEVLTQRSTL
jgi:hypothetical protein